MHMQRLFALFLIVLLAISPLSGMATVPQKTEPAAPDKTAQAKLEGLDEFIAELMEAWKVPGLAIAIIQDGKVIHLKGYGYRDVEKQLPVTPQTLFAIGSITKSFTVAALGLLVDRGKLEWDKPVREYLPEFRLHDPVASEHMTPRDLVTHRSGLPRHDLLWYNSEFTRAEMVARLRYLEPSRDFRSTFQYNNLMFMTAGYLVEHLTGTTWEEFVRREILDPLEMAGSNFSVHASQESPDFALPYTKADDELKQVPFRDIDQVGPAGSINSNVEEMSHYLLFHLNSGKYGDRELLSENNARQMRTPQMVTASAPQYPELGHSSYGLGLGIYGYRGHTVVQHGGGIDGFTALLSFIPRDNIGMIILSNRDGNPVPTLVAYNVYDRLLGLDPVPWHDRFQERQQKQEQAEEEAKKKGYTPRKQGTQPSHPLADYVGKYEHPGYGIVRIQLKDDRLTLTLNQMTSPLRHFHYDIFEVPEDPLDPFENMKLMFQMSLQGDIAQLALPLEPNVDPIVFTRQPEEQMRERSFLEPLTGEYELGGVTVTVILQGDDTLILTVLGQRPHELVPTRGLSFDIKSLTGFSVEFKKDAAGAVMELVFYQPNGTFVAKRKP